MQENEETSFFFHHPKTIVTYIFVEMKKLRISLPKINIKNIKNYHALVIFS